MASTQAGRCRKDDYFTQPRRLHLQSAVMVEPLSKQQIDTILSSAGEQFTGLRQALKSDPTLQKLAPLPLMLNLMMLVYHGLPVETILQQASLSTTQQQVLAAYVQRMLRRRGASTGYMPYQMLRWLSWLAQQMAQHNQAEFYIERLQPDWLPNTRARQWYQRLVGLVIGLVVGVVFGLGVGLVFGVVFGPDVGLVFGLGGGLGSKATQIKPVEVLVWKWERIWQSYTRSDLMVTLLSGLVGGLGFGLLGRLRFGLVGGLFVGLGIGLLGGLLSGVVSGLVKGWSSAILETSHMFRPNQGIWLSARNSVRAGLIGGLGVMLGSGLVGGLVHLGRKGTTIKQAQCKST